jgi:hydroxymethylbilane synthase
MAMAALDRLGLSEHAACVLEPSEMLPQVGQGALGLECRVDDREVLALLEAADDKVAHRNVDAERSWLAYLGGGCSAPVGAFAVESSDHPGLISLEGMIASQDGRIVLRRTAVGSDPDELGRRLGDEMLRNGGSLLDEFAGPGAQR